MVKLVYVLEHRQRIGYVVSAYNRKQKVVQKTISHSICVFTDYCCFELRRAGNVPSQG